MRSAARWGCSSSGGWSNPTGKRIRRRLLLISCCLILSIFSAGGTAFAWARHNLLTRASFQGVSWLSRFERIRVTPYTYQDDSLNPDFKPLYQNPNPEQRALTPAQFVYYDLSVQAKYGFQGAAPGGKTSARQILADFSDEPDWGMDKNLELAWSQGFMGGSQGYRHMYYPAGTWHLPQLFSSQGETPQRAVHFYRLARRAFAEGDSYWGFRFLARTLHYVQDMAQPYHTTQTAWAFFHLGSPVDATTETTKNYHFAYESLAARILELEAAGRLPPDYQKVLEETPALPAEGVEELVKKIAHKSCELADSTFAVSRRLFGGKFFADHSVPLTASQVEAILKYHQREEFDRQVKAALELAAAGSKGLLNLAYREFSLGEVK